MCFIHCTYRVIENTYLGLKNGILDQSAILLSQPDFTLTVVDCRARQWRHVPPPWSTPPIRALLVFSGLRAALASGASFNTRVAECHDAAQQLARLTGTHTDKAQPLLGDFSQETFEEHREALGVLKCVPPCVNTWSTLLLPQGMLRGGVRSTFSQRRSEWRRGRSCGRVGDWRSLGRS